MSLSDEYSELDNFLLGYEQFTMQEIIEDFNAMGKPSPRLSRTQNKKVFEDNEEYRRIIVEQGRRLLAQDPFPWRDLCPDPELYLSDTTEATVREEIREWLEDLITRLEKSALEREPE